MATGEAPAEVATELPEIFKTIQEAVCFIRCTLTWLFTHERIVLCWYKWF